jgi:hypothetical protein
LASASVPYYTGIKRIAFDTQDLNGDQMRYHVRVRRVGGKHWLSLTPEAGSRYNFVDWAVGGYPDGRYELEVIASDAHAHPAGAGRAYTRSFGPILVDNTAPGISNIRVSGDRIKFRARDAESALVAVEIAVDDGPWQAVVSNDGLVDGSDEQFSVSLRQIAGRGARLVRIRAEDSFGHRGVAGTEIK